ncbi:phosphatase PAP2 family protein [Candidatus Saccharibacteria bacterium]|nr:phosphatase PAP2 family protein [Candidatus Saccharibacteria bacterium]
MQWELITNIILISSFVVLAVFAVLGLVQWISRKSLKKVDKQLLWMPLPLLLMAITYVVFDKFIILNVRPNGSGEPSFPSTHVMVVATIFFVVALALPKYIKSKTARIVLELFIAALIGLTCVGRVVSQMHWISDTIGALVFAFIFSEIYRQIIKKRKKSDE